MFSHLCMKYIFFLLAIATIVAGIPLEETRNLTLSRRQAPPSISVCTDPNYPVWQSSHCRTKTVVANACVARDFPTSYTITESRCQPGTSCVDFIRPHAGSEPLAVCVPNSQIQQWDNDGSNGVKYGQTGSFKFSTDVLTFGMTTYDTNSNPAKVYEMGVYVNNVDLVPNFYQTHYSRIFKDYVANQLYQFFFVPFNKKEVTALAAALTHIELEALSLE